MADVQVENGHLKIAESLFVAIAQRDFSATERRVLDAVMLMTYNQGLTKAEMSIEDIRLLMGNIYPVRSSRVKTSFENLVNINVLFTQRLVNDAMLIGIQKDFDRWEVTAPAKMAVTKKSIYITNNTLLAPAKMAASELVLRYAIQQLNLKLSLTSYRVEKGRATGLLHDAVALTKNPRLAVQALKDFFDELADDDWAKNNLSFPIAYALTRFEQWYKAQPKMPKVIQQEQEASGWRYKYDRKIKQWRRSRERINKPDNRGDGKGA